MMACYGVGPTTAILWLPIVLATTFALALGVAYPATLAGIWFPRIAPFIASLMRVLFFLAAGLVALRDVAPGAEGIVRLNPLTAVFESYRAVFLYGETPAAWELLYPPALGAVVFVLFLPVYRREQREFAKLLA